MKNSDDDERCRPRRARLQARPARDERPLPAARDRDAGDRVLGPRPVAAAARGARHRPRGAYAAFGKRYAELLAAYRIRSSCARRRGSAENLALLRDPNSGVDLAFVQGGADPQHGPTRIRTSGSSRSAACSTEPVWVFYREDAARRLLGSQPWKPGADPGLAPEHRAAGQRIAVLMEKMIEANKLEPDELGLVRLPITPGVVGLLDGSIDDGLRHRARIADGADAAADARASR